MMMSTPRSVSILLAVFGLSAVATTTVTATEQHEPVSQLVNGRYLQAFDFFDDDRDLCDNSPNPLEGRPQLGPCDKSRFPSCNGDEEICYNRKPSRDHFHRDTHQHQYFIQYDRVFCYPNKWGGCSSCSPGRYCRSESRCVLLEENYPCEQWF